MVLSINDIVKNYKPENKSKVEEFKKAIDNCEELERKGLTKKRGNNLLAIEKRNTFQINNSAPIFHKSFSINSIK
ncbi:MAG: hypothetical protein FWF94_08165 [Oscillospiraceae bacterium]|nr:hypothetical protein [Oscillospiraceae bacterium]